MTLDLSGLISQIGEMVARLKSGAAERQEHLRRALEVLCDKNINLEHLRNKIAASRTTWLVPSLVEGLGCCFSPPPLLSDFTVIGTDGSHIDVDRHKSTRCYLINIGVAALSYGSSSDARLESFPRLYSDEADLVITDGTKTRDIEGTLLGLKRSVEECKKLVEIASQLPPGSSSLTLLDGTLIMWTLEQFQDFIITELLDKGFLRCLDELKKLNKDRKLALASYISYPRSTDVLNVLRLAKCPHEPADCDRYCSTNNDRPCDVITGVNDRSLFMDLLSDGERSAMFLSSSSIVQKRYGEHAVFFFYLRAGDEVARVEIPQWVANDKVLIELTHSLVLDQCRRGNGYPVALSEAHEQAVVTGADREEFWQLVDNEMIEERVPSSGSMKSLSKRTRWI